MVVEEQESRALRAALKTETGTAEFPEAERDEQPAAPTSFPDGGLRAWTSVLGGFCCCFSSYGWISSIGVFQTYYQEGKWKSSSPSNVSCIVSVQVFTLTVLAPVNGKIFDSYGCRALIMFGTFLHVFGLMTVSISDNYYQIFLAQSICSGFGVTCLYHGAINAVSTWFQKRRGLALGLVSSGASIRVVTLRARGLDPGRDVAEVAIRTNQAARLIIDKRGILTNAADRDHCMQYVVALALLKGRAPEAQYFQDSSPWATSAALSSLREKIVIREDAQMTRDYLDWRKKSLASGVMVTLIDGSRLDEVLTEFPVGHVNSDKTAEKVREKLVRNLGLVFSPRKTARAVEMLEEGDGCIHRFVDLFARDTDGDAKL